MKKQIDFIKEMNEIDEKFIEEAGQPWIDDVEFEKNLEKSGHIYSRKGKKRRKVYCKKNGISQIAKLRYITGKLAAGFVIVIALGAGTLLISPTARVAASKIKIQISSFLGHRGDIAPYTQVLNTTKTVDGIEVTLKEVILDENCLYVLIKTEDVKENGRADIGIGTMDLTIDGKSLSKLNGNDDGLAVSGTGQKNNLQLVCYRMENNDFPENAKNISLNLDVTRECDKDVAGGKVNFTFSASRKELERNTHKYKVDKKVTFFNKKQLTIKEVRINKVKSSIFVKCNQNIFIQDSVYLKGYDDKGNLVAYTTDGYNKSPGGYYFYSSKDVLTSKEEKQIKKDSVTTSPLPDNDAKSLKLCFYYPKEKLISTEKQENGNYGEETLIESENLTALGDEFVIDLIVK